MYTYGYIREAVLAHIDLTEEEAQAMDLLKRLPIFANEAMQAICAVKPRYYYFKPNVIEKFGVVVMITDNGTIEYREATDDDAYYLEYGKWPEDTYDESVLCTKADDATTKEFYHSQLIYEVGEEIVMDQDFLAFVPKQAFKIKIVKRNLEQFVNSEDWFDNCCEEYGIRTPIRAREYYTIVGNNKIIFNATGQYEIPCKQLWHRFDSGIQDDEEIDMPADLFVCLPIYIAALALQIDQTQKAQLKRSEFEIALARASSTDMLEPLRIKPSYY